MLILRIVLILVSLMLVLSGAMYLFTRNRRYLTFAWQTVRITLLLILIFALLYALERFVLAGWRVLL